MTRQAGSHRHDAEEFAAERLSLWRITFGPLVWAAHFVLSYPSLAVFCAKAARPEAHFWMMRAGVGALTALALAAIVWLGWRAWRQWDLEDTGTLENEQGNNEDRHEFLGHAAFLLSIISGIGVVYVGLPAALVDSCR